MCVQVGEYGKLFWCALERHGILCLGLYRSITQRPSACNYNRYILTNPAPNTEVLPHDKVRHRQAAHDVSSEMFDVDGFI